MLCGEGDEEVDCHSSRGDSARYLIVMVVPRTKQDYLG